MRLKANLPRPLFFKEGGKAPGFAAQPQPAAPQVFSPFEKGGYRGICAPEARGRSKANLPRPLFFKEGGNAPGFAARLQPAASQVFSPFEKGGYRGICATEMRNP
jgi:hypothetical protein